MTDMQLVIQLSFMLVTSLTSAWLAGRYTLHAVEMARYDKVAEQVLLWKLEGYRKLARSMTRAISAAERNDKEGFQNALADYDASTGDLLLVIPKGRVFESKQQFTQALANTKAWMTNDQSPITDELRAYHLLCVDAMRKEFRLGPIGKYSEPLSLTE